MVVCYFNVIGVSVFPAKADPPLIIGPDTVLPLPISLQGFEPVARRHPEVFQATGLKKSSKIAPGKIYLLSGEPKTTFYKFTLLFLSRIFRW
jgi:hypothetical protein